MKKLIITVPERLLCGYKWPKNDLRQRGEMVLSFPINSSSLLQKILEISVKLKVSHSRSREVEECCHHIHQEKHILGKKPP